jgi:hypothetical protein
MSGESRTMEDECEVRLKRELTRTEPSAVRGSLTPHICDRRSPPWLRSLAWCALMLCAGRPAVDESAGS